MTAPTEPLTPVGWDDVTDEDFVEALLNCQEQLKQARDDAAELEARLERVKDEALRQGLVDAMVIDRLNETKAQLETENAELREALVAICEGAPEEEPDWYEGDNHGDTASQAAEREHYRLAQIARAALAATEGEEA